MGGARETAFVGGGWVLHSFYGRRLIVQQNGCRDRRPAGFQRGVWVRNASVPPFCTPHSFLLSETRIQMLHKIKEVTMISHGTIAGPSLAPHPSRKSSAPVPSVWSRQHLQQEQHETLTVNSSQLCTRRQQLFAAVAAAGAAATALLSTPPAAASGILQFPLTQLNNTYYLVRAGESVAEAQGYVLTNPVAKTSQTAGLSREGKRQVRRRAPPRLVRPMKAPTLLSPVWTANFALRPGNPPLRPCRWCRTRTAACASWAWTRAAGSGPPSPRTRTRRRRSWPPCCTWAETG
jgi:hypothetical protein